MQWLQNRKENKNSERTFKYLSLPHPTADFIPSKSTLIQEHNLSPIFSLPVYLRVSFCSVGELSSIGFEQKHHLEKRERGWKRYTQLDVLCPISFDKQTFLKQAAKLEICLNIYIFGITIQRHKGIGGVSELKQNGYQGSFKLKVLKGRAHN